jgi:hypothetical protein
VRKGVQVIEVLAGRDRHLELTPEVGETRDIEVVDRIFQPRDARVLQRAAPAARARRRPALVDVDHEPHVRADGLAHGLHAPHLQLRRRLRAEPQLHGA